MTLQDYADVLAQKDCVVQCVRDGEIFIDITYTPVNNPCTHVWLSWSVTTGQAYFGE